MKLPARFAPFVVAGLVALFMTFVVSGVSTWRGVEAGEPIFALWMTSWGVSWLVAFPMLMVARPVVERIVRRMVG